MTNQLEKALAEDALNKMARNAEELGLDYDQQTESVMNEQAKGLKIAIALLKKQNDSFKIKCDIDDNSWQFEQAMLAIKQAIKDNGHG